MGHFFNKTDICRHSPYTDRNPDDSHRGGGGDRLSLFCTSFYYEICSPDFLYLDLIFWFIKQIEKKARPYVYFSPMHSYQICYDLFSNVKFTDLHVQYVYELSNFDFRTVKRYLHAFILVIYDMTRPIYFWVNLPKHSQWPIRALV